MSKGGRTSTSCSRPTGFAEKTPGEEKSLPSLIESLGNLRRVGFFAFNCCSSFMAISNSLSIADNWLEPLQLFGEEITCIRELRHEEPAARDFGRLLSQTNLRLLGLHSSSPPLSKSFPLLFFSLSLFFFVFTGFASNSSSVFVQLSQGKWALNA